MCEKSYYLTYGGSIQLYWLIRRNGASMGGAAIGSLIAGDRNIPILLMAIGI